MSISANLSYSARSLTRAPGWALALLLTIALGIGSNASVYGFVRGVTIPRLPLPGMDTLVSVFAMDAYGAAGPLSYDDYLTLADRLDIFESLGAARESQESVSLGDRSTLMSVAAVTPHLADLLQLSLGEGVVVSHRVWQMDLGARADIRSERIRVGSVDMHVEGVAPDWLEGLYRGRSVDVWMPLGEAAEGIDPGSRSFWAVGRLLPDVSPDQARAAAHAMSSSLEAIAVLPYTGMTPDTAGGMSRISSLLHTAASVVFVIACANVASFLLARASARSYETSVRVALGAGRRQLAGQLIADSLLISAAGSGVGMLLAVWTAYSVPAFFFESDAERLVFAPDISGIAGVSVACALVTIACGLAPLMEIRSDSPAEVLRREGAGPSKPMRRFRAGLVVAQMTCCCLLVISTGLLFQGFRTALQTDVGHRLGDPILATLQARPVGTRHESAEAGLRYFREAQHAAHLVADISRTAWVAPPPGVRPVWSAMRIEPPQVALHDVVMDVVPFTARSLADITVPPVAGRMFGAGDRGPCTVAIVNEEAADTIFDGNAVGRSIEDPAGERVEIVGVVGTRQAGPAPVPNRPTIYYYAEQTDTPLGLVGPARFRVRAEPSPTSATLAASVVSASYFEMVGAPTIAGRVFQDDPAPHGSHPNALGNGPCGPQGRRVGVINQEAAERYFGGKAVGGAVVDAAGLRTEIIGVVRSAPLRTSQRRVEPTIYFPMAQDVRPRMSLLLDAREAGRTTLDALRRRLELVPNAAPVPIIVTTLGAHLGRTALAPERIAAVLVGASAVMALALGTLGLYGVMDDAVRQRRREFAVRLALGAKGWRVVGQVLAEGLRLAGIGTVAGMLGSLLVARWVARLTPATGPLPVWIWIAAPLVSVGVVAMASVLPARRGLTVDPLTIMRET